MLALLVERVETIVAGSAPALLVMSPFALAFPALRIERIESLVAGSIPAPLVTSSFAVAILALLSMALVAGSVPAPLDTSPFAIAVPALLIERFESLIAGSVRDPGLKGATAARAAGPGAVGVEPECGRGP
jgi:hypothetical protein